MVEANRFAICFLSVISFPLTSKWPKEEVDFFPFDFSDCFPDSLRFSFRCKWRTETLPGCFLLSFYYMSGFGFQLLKSKYIFAEGFRKSFRWAFLRSLTACLQTSLNHGTFGSLFLEMWDFGIVLFAISIKVSVNWATGSSDRASSSDSRDIQRVRNDIQSALSNFQCSATGSSSLREVFGRTWKWSLSQRSLWVSQSNSSARDVS